MDSVEQNLQTPKQSFTVYVKTNKISSDSNTDEFADSIIESDIFSENDHSGYVALHLNMQEMKGNVTAKTKILHMQMTVDRILKKLNDVDIDDDRVSDEGVDPSSLYQQARDQFDLNKVKPFSKSKAK